MKNPAGAFCVLFISLLLASCALRDEWNSPTGPVYSGFSDPQRVTLRGYDGDAMEPFLTRDGRYLLFNNSNDAKVNTDLHYAERINDLLFEYRGRINGANTSSLDAVPSLDRQSNFYFISTRNYKTTLSTIFRGKWSGGRIAGVDRVPGVSQHRQGALNFDAEISADGNTLYFVDGTFAGGGVPKTADIVIGVRDGAGFRRLQASAHILRHVNTDQLEYAPATSSNQLELFFTRLNVEKEQIGIYRTTRTKVTAPFDPPQRISAITGFAEAPSLSTDGRLLYYHKKEQGRHVIYRVQR